MITILFFHFIANYKGDLLLPTYDPWERLKATILL